MDAITKAVYEIKFSIPKDILNLAFTQRYQYYTSEVISLDKLIIDTVINKKVLQDLNMIRGQTLIVSLEKCDMRVISPDGFLWETIIKVPLSVLNGRNIITPLSLSFQSGPLQEDFGGNGIMQLTQAMNMSRMGTPTGLTITNLELIGNNTILIHEHIPVITGYLNLMIENDKNMNNLNPRFYKIFSEACIMATKAYIYNSLIVDLNKGLIIGGHELNIIKDIIDGWSDMREQYETFLKEKVAKALFMNDDKSYSKFIKMSVNPFL